MKCLDDKRRKLLLSHIATHPLTEEWLLKFNGFAILECVIQLMNHVSFFLKICMKFSGTGIRLGFRFFSHNENLFINVFLLITKPSDK